MTNNTEIIAKIINNLLHHQKLYNINQEELDKMDNKIETKLYNNNNHQIMEVVK